MSHELEIEIIRQVHAALALGSCASGVYSPLLWDAATASERREAVQTRQAKAIEICQQCPVRHLCREFAEALPETSGVWGGVVYEDHTRRRYQSRRRLDARQRRARKHLLRALEDPENEGTRCLRGRAKATRPCTTLPVSPPTGVAP